MRIPHPHLQRLAYAMADFYHGLWQMRFRKRIIFAINAIRIRQTLNHYLVKRINASAQYVQINNV